MTPAELAALVQSQPHIPEQVQSVREELFLTRLYRKPRPRRPLQARSRA